MNFTLLQAAAKSGGWEQMIFFIPMMALIVLVVWLGETKPLIPTIFFLLFGLLTLLTTINELSDYRLRYYSKDYEKHTVVLLVFTLIYLVPGVYYLYKTIEKNSNKNKIVTTSENTVENLQIDVYTQIKNLNELKEKGILTDEEFQDKKQKLLAKI